MISIINKNVIMKNLFKLFVIIIGSLSILSCDSDDLPDTNKVTYFKSISGYKLFKTGGGGNTIHKESLKQINKEGSKLVATQSVFGYRDWEVDSILTDTVRTYEIIGVDTTFSDVVNMLDTIKTIKNSALVVPHNEFSTGTIGIALDTKLTEFDSLTYSIRLNNITNEDIYVSISKMDLDTKLYLGEYVDIPKEYFEDYIQPYFIENNGVHETIMIYTFSVKMKIPTLGVHNVNLTVRISDSTEITFDNQVRVTNENEYKAWYGFY